MKNDQFSWPYSIFSIFVCTLKYANVIRISNISFFRFVGKMQNEIGRSVHGPSILLTISFVFLWVCGPARYENTQCYFNVGLPRTLCPFESFTLDNILQQYVPPNTVAKFYPNCFFLLLTAALKNFGSKWYHWITTILEAWRILYVVSHFNLSILANETLSVSLCREIDNVLGAVRTCFDHVLSKLSSFSWERILFLKSACVDMAIQIQVQIVDARSVFLFLYESAWECWGFKKNYICVRFRRQFWILVYFTKMINENI